MKYRREFDIYINSVYRAVYRDYLRFFSETTENGTEILSITDDLGKSFSWRILSPWIHRRVVGWKSTDVSEE
jgi:hypothetical protein